MNSDVGKFGNQKMRNKLQFQVGFHKSTEKMKGDFLRLESQVEKFFRDIFEQITDDEAKSIHFSTEKGGTFFIFAFASHPTTRHLIAVITFSANKNGIWINWLGTSAEKYIRQRYGAKATNESFQMAGFGSFLILLVQLRSAARGWSTDVYLQANESQEAVRFYKKVGFIRMASNNVEELPDSWHQKVNDTKLKDLYIKFVDNETNLREAEERRKAQGKNQVSKADYLHLYKLLSFVNVIRYLQTYNPETEEVVFVSSSVLKSTKTIPLIPAQSDKIMLYFPYKDLGERVDLATKELLILGHALFSFSEEYNIIPSYLPGTATKKELHRMYKTVAIQRNGYLKLKAKNSKSNRHLWLDIEHMGLVFQWFERNAFSPVCESYEILCCDFTSLIKLFYNFMMFPADQSYPGVAESAWGIHCFLMNYPNLLFKRFLFFHQNLDNIHWMISCMCNPWFYLFKDKKNKVPDCIPEGLDSIAADDYIHGWLMFDPYYQFWNKEELSDDMVSLRDSCVWFLNMAYMYTECQHENTLTLLDFGMHRYLKKGDPQTWYELFNQSDDFEKELSEQEKEAEGSIPGVPYWFTWVARWFMHGLDGPFGKVKLWSVELESALFSNPSKQGHYETSLPNLVPNKQSLVFQQNNDYNCGVCCLLFIYDLLISQAFTSWQNKTDKKNILPKEIVFGTSCYNSDVDDKVLLADHVKRICEMFCIELILLIERL